MSLPKFEHVEIAAGLWRMAGGCENAGNPAAAACLDKAAKIVSSSAIQAQALEEAKMVLESIFRAIDPSLSHSSKEARWDNVIHGATKWLSIYGKEGV
jgi:hypothetical protein